MRSIRSPLLALLPLAREPRAGPLVVSVIPPPYTGENAHMCTLLPVAQCLSFCGRSACTRPGQV
ncbi:hypothetical protein GCM10017688_40290 [Streptomyces ramulosus]